MVSLPLLVLVVVAVGASRCPGGRDGDAVSLHKAGQRLQKEGRVDEALQCAEGAVELSPDQSPFLCQRAELLKALLVQGKPVSRKKAWEAYTGCEQAIEKEIEGLVPYSNRGYSVGGQSLTPADVQDWVRGLREQLGLHRFSMGDLVRKHGVSKRVADPRGASEGWKVRKAQERYMESIKAFTPLLEHHDKGVVAKARYGIGVGHHNIATALQEDSPAEAAEHYRKAIEYNPDQAESYTNLGLLLDGDEATAMLREGYTRNPSHPQIATQYADHLASLHRCREAVEVYKGMKDGVWSAAVKSLHHLASCHEELEGTDRALEVFDTALRHASGAKAADLAYNAGTMAIETNNASHFARAIAYFNVAIEGFAGQCSTEATCAYAYNNKGIAEERLGHFDKATESYATAVRLLPRFPRALTNLASMAK
eukprot:Sspe_Gene.58384::Locus_32014_Transcript_1_1_Confidence_1.000_Length_1327::g.58384::m.58384